MWEQTTGGLQPCPFIKVPLLLLATWTCPHTLRPLLSPYQTWGSVGLKCPSLGNEARRRSFWTVPGLPGDKGKSGILC